MIPTLLSLCENSRQKGTPYFVIRGQNQELAHKMEEACAQTLGEHSTMTYPIGGVIAINAGPHIISLVYLDKSSSCGPCMPSALSHIF